MRSENDIRKRLAAVIRQHQAAETQHEKDATFAIIATLMWVLGELETED